MCADEAEPPVDRRAGERRRYNRRQSSQEVAPPYFETFDRIASALEHIEEILRTRTIVLPGEEPAPPREERADQR